MPMLALLLYGFSTKEIIERDINISSQLIEDSKILEISVDKRGSIFLNDGKIGLAGIKKLDMDKYESYSINASPEAPKEILDELVQIGAKNKKAGMVTVCNIIDLQIDNDSSNENPQQIPQQKKATLEEIAEYNRLVKYYNAMPKDKLMVKQEDINRIMAILGRMSPEQKKNAEKINFDVPPPPPPAPASQPKMNSGNVPPPPPPPAPAVSEKEVQAQIPPPPPPPTYNDLVEKGAAFYYNGKEIKPEEARKLVEIEKKVNIEVIDIDKKPIVRLTDKKGKQ